MAPGETHLLEQAQINPQGRVMRLFSMLAPGPARACRQFAVQPTMGFANRSVVLAR
jgi:hypothetical protein